MLGKWQGKTITFFPSKVGYGMLWFTSLAIFCASAMLGAPSAAWASGCEEGCSSASWGMGPRH